MAWYVLRSQSRQEKPIRDRLLEMGVMAYVPLETRWALHATRKAPKTLVLFPGYVFAVLPDDEAIDAARSIRTVRDIMCDQDGKPVRVSNSGIRGVFLAEMFRLFDETWQPPKVKGRRYSHRWKPGDLVKVARGPFSGFVGEVLRAKGKARMDLLVTVFGRTNEINVPHSDLNAPDQQDVASRRAA